MNRISQLSLAVLVAAAASSPAHAGQSYDGCTGFIDAVPANITKSGVWCLRAPLSTAISAGAAITVSAHHAIVDCEGYALRGSADPATTTAIGVGATGRINVTVRGCRIGGFHTGVSLEGTGHAVLDSQFTGIRSLGIVIDSSPGLVRGNRLSDIGTTGGRPTNRGIDATGDVDILDNTIDRLKGTHATSRSVGIRSREGQSNVVAGNRVTRISNALAGGTYGIQVALGNATSRTVVRDNMMAAIGTSNAGIGLVCGSTTVMSRRNQIVGWTAAKSAACLSQGDLASN